MEMTTEEMNIIDAALEELHQEESSQTSQAEELPEPPQEVVVEDVIPENSGSILVSETTSRFSGATWYNETLSHNIILAGLGGIGSYVAFLLSRLNVNSITLYDDDIVEEGNMSGQLYSIFHIGAKKADAIARVVGEFSRYHRCLSITTRYTEESMRKSIMICGFDNMAARKKFFECWNTYRLSLPEAMRSSCLFIDGRLSAETLQVLCMRGDDEYNIKRYADEYLFSDSEADATICSYKQTSFMANMIGSIIVNLYVNFCANRVEGILIERDLPFFTQYEAETMYLKTVN